MICSCGYILLRMHRHVYELIINRCFLFVVVSKSASCAFGCAFRLSNYLYIYLKQNDKPNMYIYAHIYIFSYLYDGNHKTKTPP